MKQSLKSTLIFACCSLAAGVALSCGVQETPPPYEGQGMATQATGTGVTATDATAAPAGATATDATTTATDAATTATAMTTTTDATAVATTTSAATGAGGAPATATTTAAGGAAIAAAAGGAATSAGGAAAAAPPEKYCVSKVTVTTPLITDWEGYDGTTAATDWAFGYDLADGAIRGGAFPMEDTSGTFELVMLAGYSSNWALTIRNTLANNWSAWGMWFDSSSDCLDASAYTGISFWVRGEVPMNGTAGLQINLEDATPPSADDPLAGGTCESTVEGECAPASAEFAVTLDWTQVQLPWTAFSSAVGAGGLAIAVTGDEIVGLNFYVNPEWVPVVMDVFDGDYEPVPAAMELQVDNLSFY